MMKDILKQILVQLLYKESAAVIKKYQPKIVAVTGTVGKTSTKDAIHHALSQFVSVRRSPKSFNSELGVPLTILGVKNPWSSPLGWLKVLSEGLMLILFPNHYPKWLVLEVGTDKPGDMELITKWLKPDVVVATKLAEVPVHVEAFSSPEELFAEKGKLIEALKTGGTVILNADDKNVLAYKNLSNEKVMLFGKKSGADIGVRNYDVVYDDNKNPRGIMFDVVLGQGEVEEKAVQIAIPNTLGETSVYHILAALSVVKVLGEDVTVAAEALRDMRQAPGRMRLIEGREKSIIIDDTYNSSPVAVEEALKSLKAVKAKRKVAILGDMLELGRFAVDEHRKVGEKVAKIVDVLAVVGIRSRYTAELAMQHGLSEKEVFQFDDSKEAGKFMKDLIKEGDVILIKGSQGTRMERVVEELMAHPEEKERLLVRQDEEWKRR